MLPVCLFVLSLWLEIKTLIYTEVSIKNVLKECPGY